MSKANKVAERQVVYESISAAADALSNLSSSITWNNDIAHPSDQETLYISYVILRETLQWIAEDNQALSDRKSTVAEKQEADEDAAAHLAFINNVNLHELEIPLLKARLDASSWCPNRIENVCYNSTLMYWLSSARFYSSTDHSSCSKSECVRLQIDESKYETKHVASCQGCDFLIPNRRQIAEILRKGDIPVLTVLPSEGSSGIRLEVRTATKGTSYVAISHVWSNGLGKPHANALPACQINRIALLCQRVNLIPDMSG